MTLQSNPNDLDAARRAADAALEALATGEGMADASVGEYAATFAQQIADGLREMADCGVYYVKRFDWINAEERRRGRAITEQPTGNSLSSQMTKFRNVAKLGIHERKRTGVLAVFRSLANVIGCQWKYTPLTASAKAIGEYLTEHPDATDEELRDAGQEAIDNCQSSKVKTCETELAKIAKALEKLVAHETYGAVVIRAEKRRGVGYAKHATDALTLLLNAVKEIEAGAVLDA